LFSDDDPFVPIDNTKDFEKKLGSMIHIFENKGHFRSIKELPEILDLFLGMIRNPIALFKDFQKIDMRVGKIIAVELLQNARYTTHKITIDFGKELGKKISGARLMRYSNEELLGKLVVCAINLPKKQIGNIFSEVYTLGLSATEGDECILLSCDQENVKLGGKVY
jgi:tRNA-binding protein